MSIEPPRWDLPTPEESGPPEILTRDDGATIAYRARAGRGPGIVFLGGFMSDMNGTKASSLDRYAASRGRAYLRFDAFGHGAVVGPVRRRRRSGAGAKTPARCSTR